MSINPLNAISKVYLEQVVSQEVEIDEEFVDPEHGEAPSGRSPLQNVSDHPNPRVRKKAVKAFKSQMSKEYGGKWTSRTSDPVSEAKKGDGNLANNYPPYDKVTRGDIIAGALGKDEMGGKKKKKVEEGNDGNLANNYPPYDKVTRGDVIAGRLGKDQMGGKKKVTKEGFSNWREELKEIVDVVTKEQNPEQIKEKKVDNKIKINPTINLGDRMRESVENFGGTLLEMVEIDEMDYILESAYDELLDEGYEDDDIEEALEYALTEAKVTFGHDTPAEKKRSGLLAAARQKLSGAKTVAKAAVAKGARKVAKGALGVARKMEAGGSKPQTAARKPSTYRGAGAGTKERVSSGSYQAPAKKKAEKPSDPWEGSSTVPQKPKPKPKPEKPSDPWEGSSTTPPKAKAKAKATAPKRKRKSKLDDLLASVRSEGVQIDEKTLTSLETKKKEEIVKSMKSKLKDFETRYPGRGKEVMYATATKMAKKVAEQAMEIQPKVQQPTQQTSQDAKAKAAAQKAKTAAVALKTRELQTLRQTPAGTAVSTFG